MPPRPFRTAALRRSGERTAVGAPPWRGGSVEIALPGTARLPPSAFSSSLPASFFFRTPTILNFRISFWPLEPWTEPWTRDHKRACVNSNHNNTRTNHSSVQPSPLAERRIGNASAFRLAPGVAWSSEKLQILPSPRALIVTSESAVARLSGVLLYVLLHCCTAVLSRSVGGWWVVGGRWVVGGW